MTTEHDCSGFTAVKTAKQKNEERRKQIVEADIANIEQTIRSGNISQMESVHISIDGKYGAYIPNFGHSMYGYSPQFGFNYECIEGEALKHNLGLMKAKLQGYICDFPALTDSAASQNNISVTVPVTNEINIDITFEQAKQQIEDMPGLTDADTEKIKSQIDELENIAKEHTPKKKKWEKVKPILKFALDKGADVAITIMGLVMQMKLGA